MRLLSIRTNVGARGFRNVYPSRDQFALRSTWTRGSPGRVNSSPVYGLTPIMSCMGYSQFSIEIRRGTITLTRRFSAMSTLSCFRNAVASRSLPTCTNWMRIYQSENEDCLIPLQRLTWVMGKPPFSSRSEASARTRKGCP